MKIKNVVVIGSGTMGSGIAAHLCNADVPVTLLDLKTEISKNARERIHKSRPPLLICLLYTSPSPRDGLLSRMPSSA